MPTATCGCQCKMCRAPGGRHCRSQPGCRVPPRRFERPEPADGVRRALQRLKADAGSHSPSVVELERAIPGVVQVDACFLSNPYASELVYDRLRAIDPPALARMVSHYPSQGAAIASLLAPYVGVDADQLCVGNGACEVIHALLARRPGPLLLSLPTFSAYYEFAPSRVVPHRLDPRDGFALDLDELESLVDRHAPATVVIINPNNPNGALIDHHALVGFVERMRGRVPQVIVDESFGHFVTESTPPTLAGLVAEHPHLVVVNSLSKSHGIAGLRVGYAVTAPETAREVRAASLWNLNAFAEWFCGLLTDPEYVRAYEAARRRYVRESRRHFAALAALDGVQAFPTAANFALLELDRPAAEVTGALLERHGVYVRDCADKWGLDGDRYIRVAARDQAENDTVLAALGDVLAVPAGHAAMAAG